MLLDRVIGFFTSLRLTVVCLGCALVLVFAGTLAQVHLGLYVTQARYFHSLFVYWSPPGTSWKVPVWPGGYLLGGLLLVNLIAAHIKRFTISPKKIGIFLIHAGLILLFLGQFLTETFQVETFMRIEEGATQNYSESGRKNELAVIDVSQPDQDVIVAIPESRLEGKSEIQHPALPFSIRVKEYFPNSQPAPAMDSVAGGVPRIQASQGVGQRLRFGDRATTARTDEENIPTALVEIVSPAGSLGSWTVSNWLTKHPWIDSLREFLGEQRASLLDAPQEFRFENKTYRLALRPVRYYKPYNLTLLDFTHKRYRGTDIPKDFSSRVRLRNPRNGEDREVLIYMNNPLRYGGETYYQGGFEPGDTVSVLQVVRNPAWLTPYLSCTLVGLGLTVHFLMHLFSFAKRSTPKAMVDPAGRGAQRGPAKPAREKLGATVATVSALPVASSSYPESAKGRNK